MGVIAVKRPPLFRLVGAFLALLGASVILGWWLQVSPLVRVLPQFTPMVFNTALCFTLAGCGLVLPLPEAPGRALATTVFGGAVTVVASLALAEHLLRLDLGIDWASLHRWLHDGNQNPGRMSAPTASGFLMSGVMLMLAPHVRSPGMGMVVRALTLGIGAIGGLGLAGYLVSAQLLFPEYPFTGLAVHTAIGLLLLSAGLWSVCRRQPWARARLFEKEDDRIAFAGAVVLVGIAMSAGIATFAILQERVQALVMDDLQVALARRADTFGDIVELREVNARIAATRPSVLRNLRVIRAGNDDGLNIANVDAVVASFLAEGFSAIAYHDTDGNVVSSGGSFATAPAMTGTLATPDKAELMWAGGFLLRHRIVMHDSAGKAGEVRAEQPLPVLTRLTQRPAGRGETWDMGLCVRREQRLLCFPQRLNAAVFATPLVNLAGEPLPMVRALRGETGTAVTRDYRSQNVVAAYGPVGSLGLGMVLKVDAAEVFKPIREQLELAAALVLALAIGGAYLLRSQVRPLAARLIEAGNHARKQEQSIREVLESAPDAMVIVDKSGRIVL